MNQAERRAQLIKWSDSYYNRNVSIVPDHVFDEAQTSYFQDFDDEELRSTIGAPVVKSSAWKPATHKIPMGSLDKVSSEAEFLKWYSSLNNEITILSEKLDGISVDLEYENGLFVRGITRGDGVEGEDITVNVAKMKGVVKELPLKADVSVRGEIILRESDFNKVVELQKLRGEEPIKNMRNGAGGKAKDREGIYCGYLTVKCYDATIQVASKGQTFQWLEDMGFDTPNWGKYWDSDGIMFAYNDYQEKTRASLDYEIDGLVLEINNPEVRESLGYHHGRPKFARAFKFTSLKAQTKIMGIEWSLGKSGTITPVALLNPVYMGGVTVGRASLANLSRFEEMNLCIGDVVVVSRRGDVIPYIESVHATFEGAEKFKAPVRCPTCDKFVIKDDKFLRCINPLCSGAIIGGILKWIAKSGMAGDGLGESTVEKLVDANLVNTPADLYRLTINDFLSLDGFQIRSATKMYDIIQNHATVSLADFVGGLNLGKFGSSLTQVLIDEGFDTLDKLQNIPFRAMVMVKGMGESRAIDFIEGIANKNELIEDLLNYISIEDTEEKMVASADGLSGKSFCFTGAIQKIGDDGKRLTRKDMEKLVIMNGGDTASVKRGLTYLVQADPDSQSSKTKKALSLGVEILSEAKFFEMLG